MTLSALILGPYLKSAFTYALWYSYLFSGVGRTVPSVNIFPDVAEGTRWYLQTGELPLPNSTQNAVSRIQAHYKVYGKLAELRTANESPYVSTALVCRDMLNMMRAHSRDKIQYWGFS